MPLGVVRAVSGQSTMGIRSKGRNSQAPTRQPAIATTRRFSVVGIGASAGGLEACEQLFQNLSATTGLAFVLVTHLDPDHQSLLTEILQRSTTMPVVEALNQQRVLPDHVYVIPPNQELGIAHGALQLSVPELARGHRMLIDSFLRTLADDQREHAIALLLSGTGSDGTLGLQAIAAAGGMTLVQSPEDAKYDGMPASAIAAGCANHILPVADMGKLLQTLARAAQGEAELPGPARNAGALTRLLDLLRTLTGHDFSAYKKSTINRRIERRMALHELTDPDIYLRYIKEHPPEAQALMKEFLINVTSFFRDAEAFDALKQQALPALFEGKAADGVFRAWIAGCSTGEEAYSVAIVLREYLDEHQRSCKVQIYSTDLDDDAVAVARAGVYPAAALSALSPERLSRWFLEDGNGYRVRKELREMLVFATQDVIRDPPFTRLDLLCCRNLMIYLEPTLQARLIPMFHYALRPGGVLFLSPSESTGGQSELFAPLDRKWKLYRALHTAPVAPSSRMPALLRAPESNVKLPVAMIKSTKEVNFADLTRRMLLQSYAPASVVTDLTGALHYVHGETGRYLRLAAGAITANVVDMARDGLAAPLRAALQLAAGQGLATLDQSVSVRGDGASYAVRMSVRPLADTEQTPLLLLISFAEVAPASSSKARRGKAPSAAASSERVAELERELAAVRGNLQATIEVQQASNEELKSTNEELQSTNEELQSTNEELETSKEELQSVNEELITVNSELQAKIEQLAGMQNDMKNLLDNISIGTVFLNPQMQIRRYTREATQVYRLVSSDIGRPLADIKSDVEGADLLADARRVLETLTPCEREVRLTSGAWYLARLQPYRTLDQVVDGVVLTFADISRRIAAEATMQSAGRLAESIIDTMREPLLVLDAELTVVSASRAYLREFATTSAQTIGRRLYELGDQQWDLPALRDLLGTILPRDQAFDNFKVEHDFPVIGHRRMVLNARRVVSSSGQAPLILLALEVLK